MICNKCGTIYPDNGTCPNCSSSGAFFKTAGSLDDSMDMGTPVSYPNPEPAPYNEPAYTPASSDSDYMKTMPYSDVKMNVEPYVPEPPAPPVNNPTWNAPEPSTVYTAPPSTPYTAPSYASAPPSATAFSAPVKVAKPNYVANIIISALVMVIMLFAPIFSGCGFIPDTNSPNIIDIVEYIANPKYIPVDFLIMYYMIILATLMSVTALIGSCIKVKPLCIVSSILGYVSLFSVAIIMALKGGKFYALAIQSTMNAILTFLWNFSNSKLKFRKKIKI